MKNIFIATLAVSTLAVGAMAGLAVAKDAPLYKIRDCDKETVQMEMNACAGDNLAAANAELNRVYKRLWDQQAEADLQAQLKDLEKAWIAYRDKECNFEVGPQQNGGSIWPMDMDSCLQQKTDARIRELKAQLSCPAEQPCNR